MAKLLAGNKMMDVVTNAKGIVSIPGWAKRFNSGSVNTTKAYELSAVANRCIEIRAYTLSSIPFKIMDGEDEASDEHPFSKLMREVNPEMNTQDLWRATEADLLIYGKAYWYKVPKSEVGNETGFLQRLNPKDIKLVRDKGTGALVGFRREASGERTEPKLFKRDEIVFFHEYNPTDDFEGISKTDVAAKSINLEINVEQYGVDFFANYAMPAVILETDQSVKEREFNKVQSFWRRTFGGPGKRHKVGVADKGLKANVLSAPIKDLAIGDVRAESRRAICASYGVPPSIAGAWEAANYATMEVQRRSLYEDTVIPRALYMQGVINAELATDFGVLFKWDIEALPIMQPDEQTERLSMIELVRAGILTVEGAANRLGIEPDEIGDGPQQFGTFGSFGEDMAKYKRKVKKALRAGRPTGVPFKSEHIPDGIMDNLADELTTVAAPREVDAIFARYQAGESE